MPLKTRFSRENSSRNRPCDARCEGDQPPPLDHYRHDVSTLPNGQSCVTLYGPEGHESNALTWYQCRGIEPSFPDAWRYMVEDEPLKTNPNNLPIKPPAIGGWYWNEKQQKANFLMPPYLGVDDCVQTPDGLAYRSLVEEQNRSALHLDPADFDYDWRADTNEYPFDTQVSRWHYNCNSPNLDKDHLKIAKWLEVKRPFTRPQQGFILFKGSRVSYADWHLDDLWSHGYIDDFNRVTAAGLVWIMLNEAK